MGKANDSIKYNKSYPELNGLDEGMIKHQERSGAKAAALIPATTFVASATAAVLLLLLALSRIALVRPKLIESTFNSAQVEIRTDLEGSEEAYPLVYLLMPYAVGRENPVTPGGRLRLTDEEVEALGEAVLRGEIFSEKELLLFQNLSNRTDYLMLFRSKDENGDWELRKEALFIPMMRQGTEKPTPVPDDSTPKGPVAISMTPMPGTPTPPADKKSATPTPDGTATPTPTATATPTPTPTPTPSGAPAPYVPTTTVPHDITIRIIGSGQGFAGTDPEHLSPASELQANPGDTVYIKGVPEDTDDVHYLFARYEVTSGSVSNWTSSSFVMGNTDVELTFTFVRAYQLTVLNETPDWGTATYEGSPTLFPADEPVNIHCDPSAHYEFVVAYDETEHYYFTDPDFTFPMPEQDLTLFVMFDKILVGLTIEPASGGSCSYSPDAEMEVGNTYYFQEGSTVTIAATGVIEDHVFAGYYVNGSSTLITDDPLTLTMDSDTVVTPVFKQLYTIRFANDIPSYGTITCNGLSADEDHPAISVKAAEGQTVTFTLTPKTGCEVGTVEVYPSGGGTLSSSGSTYTFTVGTGNATIYVYFGPKQGHQIHVSTDPNEDFLGFEISADIYGADDTFPPGATVTITPELEGPYAYDHMVINGGSYSNQSFSVNPVTITMPDADVYVTIYFTEIQLYTITVEVDPEEVEDIYVSGTGVEATSDGYLAPEGTVITLSHSDTNSDYAFVHYTVNGTAITSNTFTLSEDTEVVAVFRSLWHNIDVATDPAGIGTVIVSSSVADTLYYYDGYYDCLEGTTVTFQAILMDDYEDEYSLVGFRVGDTLITGNSYPVNGDITVTAVFKSLWHEVYVGTDPTGIGADVEVSGTDVSYIDGFYRCPDGGTITLSVYSGDWEEEYRLVGYRIGGTLHSGSTYTCTVTSDMTVTAVFESRYHDMYITSAGGANYVSPTYWPGMEEDESLTITWGPNEGYQFSHWTVTDAKSYTLNGDNSGGTVVMGTKDVYVVVYFERIPGYYTIDVEPENYGYGSTSLSKYIAQVGETVTVTANPYTGYHFVRMVIDGVTYTSNNVSYVMPDHDVTGTAYFEPD